MRIKFLCQLKYYFPLIALTTLAPQSGLAFTVGGLLDLAQYNIEKLTELPRYNFDRAIENERVRTGAAGIPARRQFSGDGVTMSEPNTTEMRQRDQAQARQNKAIVATYSSFSISTSCEATAYTENPIQIQNIVASAVFTSRWSRDNVTVKLYIDDKNQIFTCDSQNHCGQKVIQSAKPGQKLGFSQNAEDLKRMLSDLQYISYSGHLNLNLESDRLRLVDILMFSDGFVKKMLETSELKRLRAHYSYVNNIARFLESEIKRHQRNIFDYKRPDPTNRLVYYALESHLSLIYEQEGSGIYQDPVLRSMLNRMRTISKACKASQEVDTLHPMISPMTAALW